MNENKVSIKYVLAVLFAVIFTWIIHEFAHWATAGALGIESIMRLNGTSFVDGEIPSDWQRTIVSAAGPAITIVQGVIVFFILKFRNWNQFLYPLLFAAFYMRFVAAQLSIINPNDEARISAFLGWGGYTLPIIVSAGLFYLVYRISRLYSVNWKFQVATTLLVMVFSSILIMADMFIGIRIL